ncbi:MAG TPA: M81 family metallopeptidase [Caldilineaceae bacterium]|nr:M81 family metallopeptidase [Caldilineaceae bacterium]
MRVFTAMLATETNTFSPFLTGLRNFEQTYLVREGRHGERPSAFALPLVRWRELAEARGWTPVESLAAFAMPAGITLRPVYETLRDEILRDLEAAQPVDMVLLNLHGAMVAEGYDDCEGDLTARIRTIVGPDTPIGVELDLHCHISQQLVESANAVITYKEYPHTDQPERAAELFEIIAGAAQGRLRPVTSMADCGMFGVFHTTREPVKGFVAEMQALEGKDGVLSVSLGHSFPWGDVADLGARVLVVTDNRPEAGEELARTLADRFYTLRATAQPSYCTVDEALDRALAAPRGPVVLADVADNAGGGAPNDSTFILRRMLERGIGDAAIGCIWDPVVVELAKEIGAGVETDLRIGGKMGPMSGDPVDLRVRIGQIALNAAQQFGQGANKMGDAVALHGPNGLDIVVNSHRTQTFSPHVFSHVGINPLEKRILVVKSMQHFYAGFAPIAAEILYVATPGALAPDFRLLDYRKARRTLWPLV